ncbi:MAG TPA: PRC-barrel domain-containing protein [Ohtaekwangia sp.]
MNEFRNQHDPENITGENHTGMRANKPVRVLNAKSIIGDKLLNNSGEDLGTIQDLMINIDDGRIEYVIIAFGGFMSLNQKYFSIPFNALTVDTEQHAFICPQKFRLPCFLSKKN